MVEPTRQSLYLMQNQHGLIKIGRSLNVEQRRQSLQTSERCSIQIVGIFSKFGDFEEAIHLRLNDFRVLGEWFLGTPEARAAISEGLGLPDIFWPIAYDPAAAEEWITHMEAVRVVRYLKKSIYREIGLLRSATEPSWVYDNAIYFICRAAEAGKLSASDARPEVPKYTAEVEAALTIWPADRRPDSWENSAIACCIAGLQALQATIKEPLRIG